MLNGCAERSDGADGGSGGGGTIRSFDFDFDDLEFELLLFNDERNEGGTGVELGEDEIDFEGDGR